MSQAERVAGLMLAAVVGMAVPLAVGVWLAGGHATPEQSRQHALAVAQHGSHSHGQADSGHGDRDLAPSWSRGVLGPGAGPFITTDVHGFAPEFWHAVLAAVLLAATPHGRRWVWRRRRRPPPDAPLAATHPPPRSWLALPA